MTLPQEFSIIQSLAPAADAAGRTGQYVSLKNAVKAWIVVEMTQGNAATVLLEPKQATAVAGTSVKVLANVVPIWSNDDTVNTANHTRQTDAVNFTTSANVLNKTVVFQIDPLALDVTNGFDCLTIVTGASNAANITAAQIIVQQKYPQASPPSVIAN